MRSWTFSCDELRRNFKLILDVVKRLGHIYRLSELINLLRRKIPREDILGEIINILLDYEILITWIDISCPVCGEHLGAFKSRKEILGNKLECINGHEFYVDNSFFAEYDEHIEYLAKINAGEGMKVLDEFLASQRACLVSKRTLLELFITSLSFFVIVLKESAISLMESLNTLVREST